jgi:hypothetical protein
MDTPLPFEPNRPVPAVQQLRAEILKQHKIELTSQ